MLWLDPRDYRTIRGASRGRYPTTWICELHWQSFEGRTGATVMGHAGIAMLALQEGIAIDRADRRRRPSPIAPAATHPCSVRTTQ